MTWYPPVLTLAALAATGPGPGRDLYGDPLPPGAVARVGTARLRTPQEVARLAFSPDGKLLVTTADYGPLHVWDAATGALVRTLPAPVEKVPWDPDRPRPAEVAALAFGADAGRLRVLTASGTLRAFDLADGRWGEPLARTGTPGKDRRHAGGRVSPDRTHFLYAPYADDADWIEVFALGKDKPVRRIEAPGFGSYGRATALSADNRLAAVVLEDGTAKVWDLTTGRAVAARVPPAGSSFSHVAVSPDGSTLVAVCGPKGRPREPNPPRFLLGLDAATGKERFRAPGWESWSVVSSPDGGRLIGFAGNEVLVADPATGKPGGRLRGHGAWAIFGYAFSADGKLLATGGRDHTAIIWDLAAGKPAVDFPSPRGPVDVLA